MATVLPQGKQYFENSAGQPLAGGRLYTFLAGTSTPKVTYADQAGTVPNTNPVVLDARGEALIYWSGAYKVELRDASNNLIWTVDNVFLDAGEFVFNGGTIADFLKNKSDLIVNSISALRAVDKTKFTQVFVTGYYVAGDGGGGQYWYDGADTTSADNGGTIIVAADGGRWKLAYVGSISVKQFGAKGDGVTDDAPSFLAATTAVSSAHVPAGVYVLDAMTFPASLKTLSGDGAASVLLAKAALSGGATTWLSFNFQSDLTLRDFAINISSTTHPTVVGIQIGAAARVLVDNITVTDGGRMPFFISASGGVIISNSHITDFAQSAIVVDNASSNVHVDHVISPSQGTGNSCVFTGGSYHKVTNSYFGGAGSVFFTIALIGTNYSSVENCIALGTTLEAIQITDGSNNAIRNNIIICGVGHNDFGISVFGDTVDAKYNAVTGNLVYGAGGSGIGVSANYISGKACLYTDVEDNVLVSCNVKNDADGAGVYLLGGALCQLNTIKNNIIADEGNKIRYGVYESSSGGIPNNNTIMHNACYCQGVFISEAAIVGAATRVYDLDWQVFTTTVSSQSGAITTVNAAQTYFRYKRRGREAVVSACAAITTNGTGASSVQMSMPFTILRGVLYGRENGVSGAMLQGYSGGANLLRISTYAPAYPGANGAQCVISGTVEM